MQGIGTDLILYGNIACLIILYLFIYRNRRLIGFQLGMNISIVAGGMMALVTGVGLIFQYPFHYTIITIVATLLGMLIGGLFGALFDYQTFLTGLINGLMLGVMAPMIGSIMTNQILFMMAMEVFILVTVGLMVLSIRRS